MLSPDLLSGCFFSLLVNTPVVVFLPPFALYTERPAAYPSVQLPRLPCFSRLLYQ